LNRIASHVPFTCWVHLRLTMAVVLTSICVSSGCYAPLTSSGIPAGTLPEEFRTPFRTAGASLNFALLTMQPPRDYYLGPGDRLGITLPILRKGGERRTEVVDVMGNGEIYLPLIGSIKIGDLNLLEAQKKIIAAYADGLVSDPEVNITLVEESSTSVLVLGQVKVAGAHVLPKYQNDIGHALAAAGGFAENAASYIEIHRRSTKPQFRTIEATALAREHSSNEDGEILPPSFVSSQTEEEVATSLPVIQRIDLRGYDVNQLAVEDVVLNPGDTIVVPNRKHEVFYVVGQLSQRNTVRFSMGTRARELGVGLILPHEREIDVVTAVAMAGYIDPIDSPTTVTVQRNRENCEPLLIHVDLIRARYDHRETVLVMPGDIIYLNPDREWWFRRTFDRVIPSLVTLPYAWFFQ